ncbi:MAG: PhzF family phenazine biosynthesis protein [Pseudomonadota bacterium]
MKKLFNTLDVFTEERFGGNPLAVVHQADDLTGEQMQTIAREFNLSETIFILNAEREEHRAKVRIFTPSAELPFAGHPTVGAACLLAEIDAEAMASEGLQALDSHLLVLEEGIGPVRCAVTLEDDRAAFATFELAKLPSPHAHVPDIAAIALAHGLEVTDIGFEDHKPSGFNAGMPYLCVPVRDLEAVRRAELNSSAWNATFADETTGSTFLYTRECVRHDGDFHARMFAPNHGISEDPATGSAVASFAGAIMRFDTPTVGTHDYLIEQGYEMGRPSVLHLGLDVESATLKTARIAGHAVRVSEGLLTV